MRARKTKWRRTSRLQRDIIEFVRTHPNCKVSEIRGAFGIAPRRNAYLYDSVNVLIARGLLKKRIARKQGYTLRLPNMAERLMHHWRRAYAEYPRKWRPFFRQVLGRTPRDFNTATATAISRERFGKSWDLPDAPASMRGALVDQFDFNKAVVTGLSNALPPNAALTKADLSAMIDEMKRAPVQLVETACCGNCQHGTGDCDVNPFAAHAHDPDHPPALSRTLSQRRAAEGS